MALARVDHLIEAVSPADVVKQLFSQGNWNLSDSLDRLGGEDVWRVQIRVRVVAFVVIFFLLRFGNCQQALVFEDNNLLLWKRPDLAQVAELWLDFIRLILRLVWILRQEAQRQNGLSNRGKAQLLVVAAPRIGHENSERHLFCHLLVVVGLELEHALI